MRRASGWGSWTRKPRRRWLRTSAATCARNRSLARSLPSTVLASSAPRASWPMKVTRPSSGRTASGQRLGRVVQQRPPAQRLAACHLIGQRLVQQRAHLRGVLLAQDRRSGRPATRSSGPAPRACGRRRRGGESGSARSPAAPPARAARPPSPPARPAARFPACACGEARIRRSSMNTRSADTPLSSSACARAASLVCASGSSSSSTAIRTRRSTRRGSSAKRPWPAIRRRRAAQVLAAHPADRSARLPRSARRSRSR